MPELPTTSRPDPPRPASDLRRLLERACLAPAPCAGAMLVELAGDDEPRAVARVSFGLLTRSGIAAARRAVATGATTWTADGAALAAPAGPEHAVLCRLRSAASAAAVERVAALGETLALSIANEALARDAARVAAERVAVERDERQETAYDLHDGPAQKLVWARNSLRALVRDRDAVTPDALADLAAVVGAAVEELQTAIRRLDSGGAPAHSLDRLVRDEVELLLRRERVDVELELPDDLELAPAVTDAAYRVVQEALTNAVRHGGADRVRVVVRNEDGRLAVQIDDNGTGFDARAVLRRPASAAGLGLRGMRERVGRVGGELAVDSRPGGPTRVAADLPASPGQRG